MSSKITVDAVDVDGNADAVILDTDGDTTLSAPTDDQIDFEAGGSDVATLDASALTSTVNVVLDDGAGDSPQLQFVGGSNDDTAIFYLADDAVAGNSSVGWKLCDQQDSYLFTQDSTGADLFTVYASGKIQVWKGPLWLGGVADCLQLDAAQETSISDPTGGRMDFEVAAADQIHLVDGKLYPNTDNDVDLGDATHGWGAVYVAGDVYAEKDEAGLFKRAHNFLIDPQEDFDGSDFEWLTTGWAGGAVFDGTPDGLDFSAIPESCVLLTDSVQNDFFYRYRSIGDPSGGDWEVYMRVASVWGSDVAIRIDAGSDANENDFGELIVSHTDGQTTMDIKRRYQENGGGITSSTLLSTIPCGPVAIRITAGAPNVIYVYYGFGDAPYNRLTFLGSNIGDLDNWGSAASRIGISYKRTSASASGTRVACIDFFHTTGLTPS